MWALRGEVTGLILTYNLRPLVHENREELEFLFPHAKVVPVTDADLRAASPEPPLGFKHHPSLGHLTWPLDRKDFR